MEAILQLGLPFQGDCGGRDGVVDEHCHGGGGTHRSVMSCHRVVGSSRVIVFCRGVGTVQAICPGSSSR